MLDGPQIRAVAAACADLLGAHLDAEWTVRVPDLEMTVAGVVAHAADSCLWYAIDLSAGGTELEAAEHGVNPEVRPRDLVAVLTTYASVVAAVVDAAPAEARGFHPLGLADPSGFAGMACDELLIHSDDAARGLGVEFRPPSALAEAVLRRLFPWVAPWLTTDGDPWRLLRWANGRIALDGRPRLTRWRWQCAPLDEWDGRPPAGTTPALDG